MRPLADRHFVIDRDGLTFFGERHDDDGGPVLLHEAGLFEKLLFPFLEAVEHLVFEREKRGVGCYAPGRLEKCGPFVAQTIAIGATALGLSLWSDDPDAALLVLAFLPGWFVVAKLCGLYDRDHRSLRHLTSGELPFLLVWAVAGSAILAVGGVAVGTDTPTAPEGVALWLAVALLALFLRSAARLAWRLVTPAERALVVGNSKSAESVRTGIAEARPLL